MVEWRVSDCPVLYPAAEIFMSRRVAEIIAGEADECIWLLEHPALITGGVSSCRDDLLEPQRFPVYNTRRGGQYTYHGPGQRVVYVMLDLNRRGRDVRRFVTNIEEWLIRSFTHFGLRVERRAGRIGLWLDGEERKIAAIGLKLHKWVSFHGFSVNIDPDLTHFSAIVPCGLDRDEYGVTSMAAEGCAISFTEWDAVLRQTFVEVFGNEIPGEAVCTAHKYFPG